MIEMIHKYTNYPQAYDGSRSPAALRKTMAASGATALAALKIGGRVAFERLVRPKARRAEDVPCSPDAITPEWLTAVLCKKIPEAAVTGVVVTPASAGTHERHQLIITYNEAGRRACLPSRYSPSHCPALLRA